MSPELTADCRVYCPSRISQSDWLIDRYSFESDTFTSPLSLARIWEAAFLWTARIFIQIPYAVEVGLELLRLKAKAFSESGLGLPNPHTRSMEMIYKLWFSNCKPLESITFAIHYKLSPI
jgi:hypothetical protein